MATSHTPEGLTLPEIKLLGIVPEIKDYEVEEIKLELGLAEEYDKLVKKHPITSELRAAYNSANYSISGLNKTKDPLGKNERTECIVRFKL